ncbi:hypothetical protein [Clostridium tagluense]|uniref:hypothetical protein n=1 Tax=Clostridium tagluense TaxID=360422 RepID=UPI001CF20A9F|nr:hypothetical protein [Clostridium tagluense]MCB2300285.1 hypothetical protein [Clostridium tagluense]
MGYVKISMYFYVTRGRYKCWKRSGQLLFATEVSLAGYDKAESEHCSWCKYREGCLQNIMDFFDGCKYLRYNGIKYIDLSK